VEKEKVMFKLVLDDSNILETSFKAISSIVPEVQIQAGEDGLKLDALDQSHITFVHLELNIELFEEYQCDGSVTINVDTEELMKVLKRADSDDIVELSVDEDNLIITFRGEAERIFMIRLIDMEYSAPKPPEVNHPNQFEVPFDLLKNSIKDTEIVSDNISLTIDEKHFGVYAEGELGETRIRYLHGEKINEEARSVYSLDKIKEILKADKFSDSVIIAMGTNMPICLTLETVGADAVLEFMVAPRIESEV